MIQTKKILLMSCKSLICKSILFPYVYVQHTFQDVCLKYILNQTLYESEGKIPSQIQMCVTTPSVPDCSLVFHAFTSSHITHTHICGNMQPYQTHQEAPRLAPFHMSMNNESCPSPLISHAHRCPKAQCHSVLTSSINYLMNRDETEKSLFNIFITTMFFLNA